MLVPLPEETAQPNANVVGVFSMQLAVTTEPETGRIIITQELINGQKRLIEVRRNGSI